MNTSARTGPLLLLFCSLLLVPLAFTQGPLTPPAGPPGPTMKTLDQIEPRTAISSLPFTITQSGSYYFTRSLSFNAASGDAITISANDVTLDLMGFKLSSGASVTGYAIRIDAGLRNIAVRNGMIGGNTNVTITGTAPNQTWTVNGAGFAGGISSGGFMSTLPRNCHFSHLRISACRGSGLGGGDSVLIEQVTVSENGNEGIKAMSGSITNCSAESNGGSGIYLQFGATVTNCIAKSNGDDGIAAGGGTVSNSVANTNGARGISADSIVNSAATSNGTYGFYANDGSITNCTAVSNWSHGIFAPDGSVTNSIAQRNGADGISAPSGVIAFCQASENNARDINRVDIVSGGATRTGNNPTP